MSRNVNRMTAISILTALIVTATVAPAHGQSSGSMSGGSCQHSGGAQMSGSMRQNRLSTQSQQSFQSSPIVTTGGSSLLGTNPLAQQANLSSALMLQQQQLAFSVALQRLQSIGQQQVNGLAPNVR